MKVKLLSHVRLFETPWTAALQGSSIHGIFQAGVLEWGAIALHELHIKEVIFDLSPIHKSAIHFI